MNALVLLKFTSLETKNAYRQLCDLEAVLETHLLYGRYDAVAVIHAANLNEIKQIIFSQIQAINGVVETMLCLIVEDTAINGEYRRPILIPAQ